jgi:hypothetical protein
MSLTTAPRVLRGAFVEYGLSAPPLLVTFQFNPLELARSRSLSFASPRETVGLGREAGRDGGGARAFSFTDALRSYHLDNADLLAVRDGQRVSVQEESLSFDIRLDATDLLEAGDPVAARFGVLPQLSILERMVQPRDEGVIGGVMDRLLGPVLGFSFADAKNPPLILFVWGARRVLPVNITSLSIRETEFSTLLDPVRATVSVQLQVIEGPNPVSLYSRVVQEGTSALGLSQAAVTNVVIPG